jgi:hypothetical protein
MGTGPALTASFQGEARAASSVIPRNGSESSRCEQFKQPYRRKNGHQSLVYVIIVPTNPVLGQHVCMSM